MGSTSVNKKQKKKPITFNDFVSWFEIPAVNFEQARKFYSHIFDIEMEIYSTTDYTMGIFPVQSGVGGAIVAGPGSVPGQNGPLLYLNAGEDLLPVLERIEPAGGRVVMSKTLINDESGYYALFIDTEGNKLALHSKK